MRLEKHLSTESARQTLRKRENCQFISYSEYTAMLTSRLPFERFDDFLSDTVGLRDQRDGFCFLIEREKLGLRRLFAAN